MDTQRFDAVVVGAGIAGATVAAHLAADRRVALVEAEDVAGYHTTGRSAALWYLNYGPQAVRSLTGLSRGFFEAPPEGFATAPLMAPRAVLMLAGPDHVAELEAFVAGGLGLRRITPEAAAAIVPAIRPGTVAAAGHESNAFDMDAAGLHQGFLRQLRGRGGVLALRSRTGRIERRAGRWEVEVTGGAVFSAPVVVNAAGAWGDEVAGQAGLAPLGLVPKRRTAVIVDPAPWTVAGWPMIEGFDGPWYARPEARTRLLVSPADETPMHAHDVQPDELDIALAIDRMQQFLAIEVRRIEHSWAGLRTFTPDGTPAFGWAADGPDFFWCVGQGGYGIQTSPAAGRLAADLIAGRDPAPWLGEAAWILPALDPRRFAAVASA